jgi:hypothetical protein
MAMQSGVSSQETWQQDAHLLALAADRAGEPGRWTGGARPAGGSVRPDDLADLVARFGAWDIVCAGTPEEGELYDDASPADRERMRSRQEMAADVTLASMQRAGRAPGGRDLGTAWVIARFFHAFDDHTRQRRLHTHNIVVLVSPAEITGAAAR